MRVGKGSRFLFVLVSAVAVNGCFSADGAGSPDAGATDSGASGTDTPPTGRYKAVVTAVEDSCSPARFAGEVVEPVGIQQEGGLNIPIIKGSGEEMSSWGRQLLEPPEYESEYSVEYEGCPELSLRVTWSPIRMDGDSFAVVQTQRWEVLSSCDEDHLVWGVPPDSDCFSERTFEFELVEACTELARCR